MARVQVIRETPAVHDGKWQLCFQWCRYIYDDGGLEHGYRFIWKRPDSRLQAARGQARLPSLRHIQALLDQARAEGWGDYDAATLDAT